MKEADKTTGKEIQRYLANWHDEMNSAALYQVMAEHEENDKMAEIYRRLSATERNHADRWAERLKSRDCKMPPFKLSWRTKVFSWLVKHAGVNTVLPTLSSLEDTNANAYGSQADAADLAPTEHSHAHLLNQISSTTKGGVEGSFLARIEGRHRAAGGNALRAAVLGASDGLLSNFNLVMGVAGAEMTRGGILLTGLAGLLAGSISMALGEWISVQSSRELYKKQIQTEKEEIAFNPKEETEELVLIYQARGLNESSARMLASEIMSNEESALDTLAREELGIDPKELGGSAWEAAFSSFLLFAIGAIMPVIPYLFLQGAPALAWCAILSAAGFFLIGAAITLFTGRSVVSSGLRQVVFGLVAATIAYVIGHFLGISIA